LKIYFWFTKNSFHCKNQALSGTNSIGFFKVIACPPLAELQKKIKIPQQWGIFLYLMTKCKYFVKIHRLSIYGK